MFLAIADEGRRIFVMGHPEYDRVTLDKEYKRDKEKDCRSISRSTIIRMMMIRKAEAGVAVTWEYPLLKLAELLCVPDHPV